MITQCNRCLLTSDIAHIHDDGECEYCKLHDKLESMSGSFGPWLNKLKAQKGKYNCLIGISGGGDSSSLLWASVRLWGLRPLVIHFDNHWNAPEATHNMDSLIKKLGVDEIIYRVNKREYDDLNKAFLAAGLPDADIPNDIAMTKLMYETADKYGIKYILNGHDFRTEGSTPRAWTYMDAKYIQSVYKWFKFIDLKNYPLFTFWDQIKFGLKGIRQIRPFHFKDVNRDEIDPRMRGDIQWRDYGGKHCENVYTEFVGSWLLPNKFGIDKRIVYLSALVRSGKITKDEAVKKLKTKPKFDINRVAEYMPHVTQRKMNRDDFDRYNFKRYRLLIWIMAKVGIVPYTFYIKYCKGSPNGSR